MDGFYRFHYNPAVHEQIQRYENTRFTFSERKKRLKRARFQFLLSTTTPDVQRHTNPIPDHRGPHLLHPTGKRSIPGLPSPAVPLRERVRERESTYPGNARSTHHVGYYPLHTPHP